MFFNYKLGIDLGTANVLIYLEKKGIVLNEPTVVAYRIDNKEVLAVGNEAKEMLGRTPNNIVADRPLRDGVIADYKITSAMIRYFLKKALGRGFLSDVMISIPGGASQVEKRAVVSACKQAGAKNVYLIEEPLAAAIGAGLPISEPSGNMIVNLGGGTSEIAIISLGQLVAYKTVRVGGTKLDLAIMEYLRKEKNFLIGERTAEEIKMKIGTAFIEDETELKKIEVKGRDFYTGLPKTIEISEDEIKKALDKNLKTILDGVKSVLGQSPPELSADIVEKGIVLSGGSAMLGNIDKFISYYTGVPAFVVEDPLFCVIKGIGIIVEHLDSYKKSILSS
ncbi:MAG: rod shape-determining protein [Patescibacteria group bacterium]|nr:MAG: rod shape-determining protein [Patescibacteria group bacterium]